MFLTATIRPAVFAAAALVLCGTAFADGKLAEKDMTKADYDKLTETKSSDPADAKPVPLQPIHDMTNSGVKDAKSNGAVKLIKGKDWKDLSPKDRDKRLRDLKKPLKPTTIIVIEIPSGNVWAVDPDQYALFKIVQVMTEWTKEEQEKLPKAVKAEFRQRPRRTPLQRTVRHRRVGQILSEGCGRRR